MSYKAKKENYLNNHHWLFLNTGMSDGSFNMACDDYLLESVFSSLISLSYLRVYSWSCPTYTIGAGQTISEIEQCFVSDIPVVRRLSGGKAVLHGQSNDEITYSICMQYKKNFKDLYFDIGKVLINFLNRYDLQGQVGYLKNHNINHADCFESKTQADIVVDEIKVIGSAQFRKNGCILQHGSIRLDKIKKLTNNKIDFNDAIFNLKASFELVLNIKFLDSYLRNEDYEKINKKRKLYLNLRETTITR